MPWRALLGPALLALALLATGWHLAVPALVRAPAGFTPALWATLAAALAASLPAEVALGFAFTAGAAGLILYATRTPWHVALDGATAAAGLGLALAPAAGAAVAGALPEAIRHGRALSLAQLSTGLTLFPIAGGWCFFAPSVVHAASESTRGTFRVTLAVFGVLAVLSAGVLAWMLGRREARRLERATLAVRWLDALTTPGEAPAGPPPRDPLAVLEPHEGVAVAQLGRTARRLRERLAEEVAAHEAALARARHADQAREEFLRVVSHELRTPLNAIMGYAQLLLEGLDGPLGDEAKDSVQVVLDSGRQLSALVDDVVDLAMLTSGRPGLKLAGLDVGALVREVARAHAPLLLGRPLELQLELADDLPPVLADRKRLRQVLTNLLANALKFTDAGTISVSARAANHAGRPAVELSVADTGVGIAEHELPGIFDEYKQGTNTGARREQGAGLGLAICRRLVELHGGQISAESRAGEGARFTLSLPVEGPARGGP
jgi:signal transduction histidine kinase